MLKKILFSLLLICFVATNVEAQTNKQIEIFDITQEKVVKKAQVSKDIQEDVKHIIQNTTGVYPKVQPLPEKGYIVKVPLDAPYLIHNQWFHGHVDKVFIIFPSNEQPYYLILDPNHNAQVFNFKGDTSSLIQKLKFEPLLTKE